MDNKKMSNSKDFSSSEHKIQQTPKKENLNKGNMRDQQADMTRDVNQKKGKGGK